MYSSLKHSLTLSSSSSSPFPFPFPFPFTPSTNKPSLFFARSPDLKKIMAMAVDTKDVEAAEQQLKGMTHSEQHYFNRYVPYVFTIPRYHACYLICNRIS